MGPPAWALRSGGATIPELCNIEVRVNWARLPYDVLATISTRIINEVRGTSRVTYDISGKPPATIEWE